MRAKLAFAVVCLAAHAAWAGTISIQIRHSAELDDGTLRAAIEVSNGGDEEARGVTPTLRFQGNEARGDATDALPPGDPAEMPLELAAGALTDGRWPYTVRIDYADTNLYPFQAVSVGTFQVGKPPLPKLSVTPVATVKLADEAELSVTLKNLSESPKQVTLRAVGPEAIEARASAEAAKLDGWEERSVSLGLVNRAALPGSVYPLFVTAEWDEGDVHQTVVAHSTLEILAEEPASAAPAAGPGLWIGGALLLVAAGFLLFRLGKR